MSKYNRLKEHLNGLAKDRWAVDFSELENILGMKLPASARNYQAWWSNQKGKGHSQSSSWQEAGWKTENLDLARETVTFSRLVTLEGETEVQVKKPPFRALTIAQAKLELAKTFGVSTDNIEIIIKG